MAIDTLLFDLDGTLVDQFQPGSEVEFAWRAIRRMADLAPPWQVLKAGRAAHRALKTHGTELTNFEAMVAAFCRHADVPPEAFRARTRAFFSEDFQRMAWRFRPIPGAGEAVRLAEQLGFALVLATNPTVPQPTIQHRLAWAGLGDVAWTFITHPENMTRAKPDVAYYQQLLAHIGRPPERCLMIGNDFRKDLAAMDAGIRTFLLDRPMSRKARAERKRYEPDHFGSYDDLQALIRALAARRQGAR